MTSFLDRVAAAPISWGVCEAPGWGLQLSVDRVLSEAQSLGFAAFEQGALGWLPTDPAQQHQILSAYGMTLVGGFVPIVIHDPAQSKDSLAKAERVAADMAAAGGTMFITAIVADTNDWSRPDLSSDQWSELFTNLGHLDEIVGHHGLTQAVHPHIDTLVETDDDLTRFFDSCSTLITFDTGHLAIGGVDVVEVARNCFDRIGLVHLKDVDADVAARERSGELDLVSATQAGLFPALGRGMAPVAEVIELLEAAGYSGWYTVETDQAIIDGEPADGEGPLLTQAESVEYLRSLPIGAQTNHAND